MRTYLKKILEKQVNKLANNRLFTDNLSIPKKPLEIDLIIEGGAFNGYYGLGCLLFLKEMEKHNFIKVNRISGTSAGALIGIAYILNQLDDIIEYYSELRAHFKNHLNMGCLKSIIHKQIGKINKKTFDKIKTNKIFLTYYNKNSFKQCVKSIYESKEELCAMLQATSHIPFITQNTLFYRYNNNNYIDGGMPYMFPKDNCERKIIYISIINLSRLTTILSTSNEITPYGRISLGIFDTYKFFIKKSDSVMCSYLNDWGMHQYASLVLKKYLLIVMVYSVLFINKLAESVSKATLYQHIKNIKLNDVCSVIFYDYYRNFILYCCF